jgi:hypothetical protein
VLRSTILTLLESLQAEVEGVLEVEDIVER